MPKPHQVHRGIAAVEAAVALPFLVILTIVFISLGTSLNETQSLQNSARQGARAAISVNNSNAEVVNAVMSTLGDKINADDVDVRIAKLNADGTEAYEVQNLNENEEGELIKITVSYLGGSLTQQFMGDDSPNLVNSVIVRREDSQ